MKFRVQKERGNLVVWFDQELPVLPVMEERFTRQRNLRALLDRTLDIRGYASQMLRANRGRFQLEVVNPSDFECFLRDLVMMAGVEEIRDSGRYYIAIRTSWSFDWEDIGKEIGQLVHRYFYPHESCEEQAESGKQDRGQDKNVGQER